MSLRLKALNFLLRSFEKPRLEKLNVEGVGALRKRFEWAARFGMRSPRGVRFQSSVLQSAGASVPAVQIQTEHSGAKCLLYLHGGGYFLGSAETHKKFAARLAKSAGITEAVLPEYRLAPEHVFPDAVDDAVCAYQALLAREVAARDIVIAGDSAGGGLAMALLHRICTNDVPKPACVVLFSPLGDLGNPAGSRKTLAGREAILPASRLPELAEYYLAGGDVLHPEASPVFGNFSQAPPVMIFASKHEALMDDAIRLADRLRSDGGACELHLTAEVPHVWPFFAPFLPEANVALTKATKFMREHLAD